MKRADTKCHELVHGVVYYYVEMGPQSYIKWADQGVPNLFTLYYTLWLVLCVTLIPCSDGWILGRMEKKRVKNRRENWWEGCLDERERGREKWWGPAIFSLGPPQFNLSKIGRKWGRMCWTKLPFSLPWPTFCLFLLLSFRCFFVLFFFFFFFFA